MESVRIEVFSVFLEAYFPRPRPFAKDQLDRAASWLTDPKALGLRPNQVRVRHTDIIFDYELRAELYGGNAALELNASRIEFNAHGARTAADLRLLERAMGLVGAFAADLTQESLSFGVGGNAHAALSSSNVREELMRTWSLAPHIGEPIAGGYLSFEGWENRMRFQIEPSFQSPKSLFFSWRTDMAQPDDWGFTFSQILRIISLGAADFGLKIEELD